MKHTAILLLIFLLSLNLEAQTSGKNIKFDSTDLGITMNEAIHKFNLDTTKFRLVDEPPMVVDGIMGELSDSSIFYLNIKGDFIEQPNYYGIYSILNEKVIGIAIVFADCKKKRIGRGFQWWGIHNPYCNQNKN